MYASLVYTAFLSICFKWMMAVVYWKTESKNIEACLSDECIDGFGNSLWNGTIFESF